MTRNSTGCASRSGFTMVEVVITLVLTVLVLAGAYAVSIQSMKLSRAARNEYIAATMAKNRLERARNFQYSDLYLLAESSLIVNDNGMPTVAGQFSRSTTVVTNFGVDLTQITVNVKVKNRKTGAFGPAQQTIAQLFTPYPNYAPTP